PQTGGLEPGAGDCSRLRDQARTTAGTCVALLPLAPCGFYGHSRDAKPEARRRQHGGIGCRPPPRRGTGEAAWTSVGERLLLDLVGWLQLVQRRFFPFGTY